MSHNLSNAAEREAFEQWYSDEGKAPQAIERSGDGYKYMGAHSAWQAWQAAWRAAVAAEAAPAVPQGWKLVPVVPTHEMMLHKSSCEHHAHDDYTCPMRSNRKTVWANMLAAAPQPAAQLAAVAPMSEAAVSHCINQSLGEADQRRALVRVVERQCALNWGLEFNTSPAAIQGATP